MECDTYLDDVTIIYIDPYNHNYKKNKNKNKTY